MGTPARRSRKTEPAAATPAPAGRSAILPGPSPPPLRRSARQRGSPAAAPAVPVAPVAPAARAVRAAARAAPTAPAAPLRRAMRRQRQPAGDPGAGPSNARQQATPVQVSAFIDYLKELQSTRESTRDQNAKHLATIAKTLDLVPVPPSLRFIEDNIDEIMQYIIDRQAGWSINTVISKLSALTVFATVGKNLGVVSEGTIARITNYRAPLLSERNISRAQQQLTERQEANWVTKAQLKARAQEHIDRFEAFYNSKQRITEFSSENDKRIIIYALISRLYVLDIPPRSQPYCDAIIENFVNGLIPDGRLADTQQNFIDVHNRRAIVVGCCSDKVSGLREGKSNLGPDTWELSEDSSKLVIKTLEVWNRRYLFGHAPMEPESFRGILRRCFTWSAGVSGDGHEVLEKVVGIQLLRTIWCTYWYIEDKDSPRAPGQNTTPEEARVAKRMRHSPATQRTDYRRLVEDVQAGRGFDAVEARPVEPHCEGQFVYSATRDAQAARIRYAAHAEEISRKNLERYHADPQTPNQKRIMRKILKGEKVRPATMQKWGLSCVDGRIEA